MEIWQSHKKVNFIKELLWIQLKLKRAENGFVVVVQEDDIKEYVFVREQHLIKFIKEYSPFLVFINNKFGFI